MILDKIKSIFRKEDVEDPTLTATRNEYSDLDENDQDIDEEMDLVDRRPTLVSRIKNIPFFEKFLNRNNSEGDTQVEINLGEELPDTDDQQYSKKSLFKITKIKAIIIFATVVLLLFADDEAESDSAESSVKENQITKKVKKKVRKDIEGEVVEKKVDEKKSLNDDLDVENKPKIPKNKMNEDIESNKDAVIVEKSKPSPVVTPDPEIDLSDIRSDQTVEIKEEQKSDTIENQDIVSDDIFSNDNETSFDINDVTNDVSNISSGDIVGDESEFDLEEETGEITSDILKSIENKISDRKEKNKVDKVNSEDSSLNYNEAGRGLVFNCIDGHWACVNGNVYNKCHELHQLEKTGEKKISCYADSIFETDRYCAKAQLRKIASMVPKDFCL